MEGHPDSRPNGKRSDILTEEGVERRGMMENVRSGWEGVGTHLTHTTAKSLIRHCIPVCVSGLKRMATFDRIMNYTC